MGMTVLVVVIKIGVKTEEESAHWPTVTPKFIM